MMWWAIHHFGRAVRTGPGTIRAARMAWPRQTRPHPERLCLLGGGVSGRDLSTAPPLATARPGHLVAQGQRPRSVRARGGRAVRPRADMFPWAGAPRPMTSSSGYGDLVWSRSTPRRWNSPGGRDPLSVGRRNRQLGSEPRRRKLKRWPVRQLRRAVVAARIGSLVWVQPAGGGGPGEGEGGEKGGGGKSRTEVEGILRSRGGGTG